MLNTKYIIYKDNEDVVRYFKNDQNNGNAWFVNSLKAVQTADQEITALDSINTKTTAIFNDSKLSSTIYSVDSTAVIKLVDYKLNQLVYESNNSNDGFAVFSEIYYENGWDVFIDNVKVDLHNVNYVLRGLNIPKGTHRVTFKFNPSVVKTGSNISLISTIFLILITLGLITFNYKKML